MVLIYEGWLAKSCKVLAHVGGVARCGFNYYRECLNNVVWTTVPDSSQNWSLGFEL